MTETKQLTPEMLADLRVPSDPRVSPDGRWLVAAVAPASKREEHPCSALWIADVSGDTPPRQITTGRANDTHPRWSADSREIAFLSDRGERGTNQVQLLSLDGGEARQLTGERGGVSDLCWLPGSGRRIAYLANDARDEETEKRRKDERDDPNVYGEFWPYARIVIHDLDTHETRRLDTGERHVHAIVPSPDGRRVAAVMWDTPETDNWIRSGQIVIVDLETGDYREVVGPGFSPESIVWSRAGTSLGFIGMAGPTAVSSKQLWVVDLEAGTAPRCLSEGAEYCFSGLARPDTWDHLLALIAVGTESEMHRIDPETGESACLMHFSGDLAGLSVSDDGSVVGVVGSTPERPDDLYAGTPGELRRLSDFHDVLDGIAFGPQEVVTWERAGFQLDGILIWPPGKTRTDGPLPMIVSIHGGPYGRWANEFISRFGRWIAQHGYLVFLPNPRGGMGHGQAFAESVLNTVGNEDYRDIMAGVDMLVDQGLADPDRLGCGGWSQGGFMTAWIAGQTGLFKAGVMGAGVSDWGMMIATSDIPSYENLMGGGNPYESIGPHSFDAQSPVSYVHRVTTPVLILHGEEDERVPVSQAIFFHRGLRRYGVPTELVTYPREPHGIQERNHQIDLLQRIVEWYQRWIPVE